MIMAMELIRHIAGLYGGKAIKGDITQVYITGNEIWMAQQVLAEQAEGAQGDLWAVHAKGPDDLYAAFSREDAEKHAAELNALPMPKGIAVSAVVVASPWPAAEHWKYLAEQEREHNGALVAQAGQVPKELREAVEWADHLLFECGALVQTRAPSVHVYNKAFAAIEAAKTLLAGAPAQGGE
ncbi:hypothetical protein [Pseudomonas sp. AAC]|uniref:hypothetical protein n=1 Tax=Pseudomonas sp. AAC TaxID=1502784 RepID=UPI0004D59A79|nr:hypothetical protein [Pseudomonas sp. AAC]KES23131.1 hypothetical protein FG99_16385 [Pseudomonas sp. AAC]